MQGGVQSLSRSLFGRLVPEGKNAEFFGFYNMMGKFATVLGPLLIAIVAGVTHNERASIVSLVLLFVIGGVLLLARAGITPRSFLTSRSKAAMSCVAWLRPETQACIQRGERRDALGQIGPMRADPARVSHRPFRGGARAARRAQVCAWRATRRGRCGPASRARRCGAG